MTAPTITGLTTSVTFGENTVNAAPQIIDNDVTVTDAEGNFNGGGLTVSGHFGGDSVSINNQGTGAGQIGFSGGNISYGGTAIGTATGGGAGSELVVTFNANATTAAVEAVVENLTYANSNNVNPATSRTLKIVLTDAAGEGQFIAQAGADSPFTGIDVGLSSTASLGDLDNDGDLDLVSGDYPGGIHTWLNTGTASAPVYTAQSGAANPFNGVNVGGHSYPVLVDLDGDGDLDAVVGEKDGNFNYFKNTGTASAPVFTLQSGASDPFNGIDPSSYSAPAFGDIDGDGLKDMVMGTKGGALLYYKNTGSASAPAFSQQASTIFNGFDLDDRATPTLGDVDGDGDLDLVVGEKSGNLWYLENTGTTTAPNFVDNTGTSNPFTGIDVGNWSSPTLADVDHDGDLDVVAGDGNGAVTYFKNTPSYQVKVNVFTENDVPVAEDTSDTTTEDEAILDSFDASDADSTNINDGTIVNAVIDSQPAKGSVTFLGGHPVEGFFYEFSPDGDFEALAYGESEAVTFTWHAVDNTGAASEPGTVTITVTGVNDDANLSGVATSVTVNENASPAIIDADVTVTDPEGNFDGGHVTVSGLLAEDMVSLNHQGTGAGQIGFSGGIVTWGGTAIGTATGGAGTDFVVTLNADATTAAVDALVQTITYANGSDAPTAIHTLTITVADEIQAKTPVLAAHTGADNPFAGIVHGEWNTNTFGDLDGDGDLDLVAGGGDGKLYLYENTGSASSPTFSAVTGAASPFAGFDVGINSSPTLADLDGDGDLDLAVGGVGGGGGGTIAYFENTGSSSDAAFTARSGASNPFNGIPTGGGVTPAFGDVDGDGDLDLIVMPWDASDEHLKYYENTGSSSSPQYEQTTREENPFSGVTLINDNYMPALGDFDGDGDLDLAVGQENGGLSYVVNVGTATDPNYAETSGTADPLAGVAKSTNYFPSFVDIDADGDLDVATGLDGKIILLETTGIGKGASATVTVNVTASNDAPVASDDAKATDEDTVLAASVPAATDIDGTIASYALVSGVAKGSLTFNANGSYSFNPSGAFDALAAAESEQVTFTYRAIDNDGAASAIKTVTVTVSGVKSAPELNGLAASVTYGETAVNTSARIIDGNVTLTDAEGNLISSLVVKGLLAEDVVSINNQGTGTGQIGFSGGNVTYQGVLIGTATGGNGANLVVTFNANATTTAVEALIENLTYANTSDTPTASRGLSIVVTDATGETMGDIVYSALTGTDNPFNGIDVGANSVPAFGDLDGDGDLDMAVGGNGVIGFYENTGTESTPVFVERTGAANPFQGIDTVTGLDIALADIDGDGDLDAAIGNNNTGLIQYYRNTGSAASPQFVLQADADNPFSDIDLTRGAPTFADLDNDGDLDLAVGWGSGDLEYFENTGSATAPQFVEASTNPFAGLGVLQDATPSFADVDGDGDYDVAIGEYGTYAATVAYLENIGTADTPNFIQRTGDTNPFSAITSSYRSRPALVDLDGDGHVDLALGDLDGGVAYYQGSGSKAGVTVHVTAENDAPVASDDAKSTDENTAISGTVGTSDVDGTVASHSLVSGVAKGSLTFLEDGSWSFDPDGHFDGLDAGESEQVTFTYLATDNNGGQSAVKTVTITVNGVSEGGGGGTTNRAPSITSASAYAVAENTTAVGTVTASDADGETPVLAIAGGADAFLFTIDATTGALSFNSAPDFEEPGDADGNNTYEVAVSASDGTANDTETLTVTVTDVDGVTIKGSKKKDTIGDTKTVKGQAMPTGEEDTIIGKGKNDKLSGLGGNDLINGGKGKDKLFGDDGDDQMIGGKTNDKLSGGLGEDSFVFNAKLKDNVDKVKDFQAGIDSFVIDDHVFKKLSPGPLSVEEFVVGKMAKDGDDHVLYNQKNGQLLYDADGKGGKDAFVFAKVGKGMDLDANDFLVI